MKPLQGPEFLDYCKKTKIVLVHKKENNNLLKNYRLRSLLPICGKFFERLILKDLFNYFSKKILFIKCQSGFLPGNSCISQLLSTVYDINSSCDCDPTHNVRGIFLNISKAFGKVLNVFFFKLKSYVVK